MSLMDRRPSVVCSVCNVRIMTRLNPDGEWKIREHYRSEGSSILCPGGGDIVTPDEPGVTE